MRIATTAPHGQGNKPMAFNLQCKHSSLWLDSHNMLRRHKMLRNKAALLFYRSFCGGMSALRSCAWWTHRLLVLCWHFEDLPSCRKNAPPRSKSLRAAQLFFYFTLNLQLVDVKYSFGSNTTFNSIAQGYLASRQRIPFLDMAGPGFRKRWVPAIFGGTWRI